MATIPDGSLKSWRDNERIDAANYTQEREVLRAAINDAQEQINVLKEATKKDVPGGVIGVDEYGHAYTTMFYDFINGRPFNDTIDDIYKRLDDIDAAIAGIVQTING